MTKLSELSPEIRKQILSGDAGVAGAGGVGVRAAPSAPKPREAAFRCFGCKETFVAYAPAERHSRERKCGTGRLETLYEQEKT